MTARNHLAIAYPPVCCLALCALLWATPAAAATFLVDSTEDAVSANPGDGTCADSLGRCTLRAAVQEANALGGSHTIVLPAGVYTLAIPGNNEHFAATGDLDLHADITVVSQDLDPNTTIIDGGGLDRVFEVTNGANAILSHLTIRNGVAGINNLGYRAGGGIAANGNNTRVTIDSCIIFSNRAAFYGGGIDITYAYGVIRNTTVYMNRADNGGGIGLGLAGYVEIHNSTLSGNRADTNGGGLLTSNLGASLNNVTIVQNLSNFSNNGIGDGGGIAAGYANNIVMRNSIVAANNGIGGGVRDCHTPGLNSMGHNLVGTATGCNFVAATGDIAGDALNPVDPGIGPYARTGGPTPTHALRAWSPALDAGFPLTPGSGGNACEALDQRGLSRVEHGLCDMGAFQRATSGQTLVVNSTVDAVDASPGDGVCASSSGECTLRAAIQEANALLTRETILVPAGIYVLGIPGEDEDEASSGDLDINDDLTLLGAGPDQTIIDGGNLDRVLEINNGAEVDLSGVSVRNGYEATGSNGGGIALRSSGILNLSDCAVTGNRSESNGGGINSGSSAVLTVTDCRISGNTAGAEGGGISGAPSTMTTISNTSIDGNQARIGGGLSISVLAEALISGSTLSNNEATNRGGAIATLVSASILTLTNSTLSGNLGGSGGGGGISLAWNDQVSLRNVTVTGNSSRSGNGGGVSGYSGIRLRNSVIAGNIDPGGEAPDCDTTITSEGYNLLGDDTGCTFLATAGDLWGTAAGPIDPLLGPLADNGGSAWTHAPFLGSPVLDAGHPAAPGSGGTACEATDQRNLDRNLSARCDMGAMELLRADLSLAGRLSPEAVESGDTVSIHFIVTNQGPDVATDAILSSLLPGGATFLGVIGADWSCAESSGTVTCAHGILLPGSGSELEILFRAPDAAGTQTTSTTLSSSVLDPETFDNGVQLTGTVYAPPPVLEEAPGSGVEQDGSGDGVAVPIVDHGSGGSGSLWRSPVDPSSPGDGMAEDFAAETEAEPDREPPTEEESPPAEEPAADEATDQAEPAEQRQEAAASASSANAGNRNAGMAILDPLTGTNAVQLAGIQDHDPASAQVYPPLADGLWEGLDKLRQELSEVAREQESQVLLSGTVKGAGLLLLAGVTNWYLKAATLMAGLLSALPLWMRFDPLPVLLVSEQERRRREIEAQRMRRAEERRHRGIGRLLDSRGSLDDHAPTKGSSP